MQQIINSSSDLSSEIPSDTSQTQVVLHLSLSYESLVQAISQLELKELIQFRRLLDHQIHQALADYKGKDELILAEINNSRLISQEFKNSTENLSKEEVIEDFRQAWHEAMTGQTIPVAQLWEEMSNA